MRHRYYLTEEHHTQYFGQVATKGTPLRILTIGAKAALMEDSL